MGVTYVMMDMSAVAHSTETFYCKSGKGLMIKKVSQKNKI